MRWSGRERGEGPTLIEAMTYRLGFHNTTDNPRRYLPARMLERPSGATRSRVISNT